MSISRVPDRLVFGLQPCCELHTTDPFNVIGFRSAPQLVDLVNEIPRILRTLECVAFIDLVLDPVADIGRCLESQTTNPGAFWCGENFGQNM